MYHPPSVGIHHSGRWDTYCFWTGFLLFLPAYMHSPGGIIVSGLRKKGGVKWDTRNPKAHGHVRQGALGIASLSLQCGPLVYLAGQEGVKGTRTPTMFSPLTGSVVDASCTLSSPAPEKQPWAQNAYGRQTSCMCHQETEAVPQGPRAGHTTISTKGLCAASVLMAAGLWPSLFLFPPSPPWPWSLGQKLPLSYVNPPLNTRLDAQLSPQGHQS